MRLFLHDKREAPLIIEALTLMHEIVTPEDQRNITEIIDRMQLCLQLQNNERRAKERDAK